jgi:hypothetical protein
VPLDLTPLQLYVQKVERQNLTPFEVGLGHDTKFVVTYGYKSLPQGSNRIQYVVPKGNATLGEEGALSEASNTTGKVTRRIAFRKSREAAIEHAYLLALANVPPSNHQLVLKDTVMAQFKVAGISPAQFPPGSKYLTHSPLGRDFWVDGPSSPVSFIARKAGDVVKVPRVSKAIPLRYIKQDKVDAVMRRFKLLKPGEGIPSVYRIKVAYTPPVRARWKKPRWKSSAVFADETGREYPDLHDRYIRENLSYGTDSKQPHIYELDINVSPKNVPRSAKRVSLKVNISVDDCWPLPVEVVIQDDTARPSSKVGKRKRNGNGKAEGRMGQR